MNPYLQSEDLEILTTSEVVQDESEAIISYGSSMNSKNHPSLMERVQQLYSQSFRSIQEVHCDDRNNSSIVSGWNVSNLIQGIGILGIPFSVRMGSWVALCIIIVVAAMCCFTGKLLIDCLYRTCPGSQRRVRCFKNYSTLGEEVCPRFGHAMVTTISVVEMFGGLCLYIILMSSMSETLIKYFSPEMDIYYCAVITTYATLPMLFVTRLSIISWSSLIAVIALLTTIGLVVAFCFSQINVMSLSNLPQIEITSIPVSFGIIVFSYCGHAVFPNIEASMKKPHQYPFMLNVVFVLAAILKLLVGVLSVAIFGNKTAQQFSENMACNVYFKYAVSLSVFLNVFFSVPLIMFVISERTDAIFQKYFSPALHPGGPYHFIWVFLTRAIMLSMSLLTTMLVPHFALLMGLVGSITGTCLCFVFPCWFHVALKRKELSWCQIGSRIFVGFVGLICGIFGVFYSMKSIVETFYKR